MRTITLLLLSLMSLQAQAHDTEKLSQEFESCIQKSDAVDPVMLDCNSKEWAIQDKRLNTAYKKLLVQLSTTKRKELQEAQRAWVKYVEAKCSFYWDDREFNGTADRLAAATCRTTERAKRASELEQFIGR